MRPLFPYVSLTLCALVGCTTVRVEGPVPTVTHYLGVVNIHTDNSEHSPTAISTRGVGLMLRQNSVTLGYLRELMVTSADASPCRVFIFVQKESHITDLKSAIASASVDIKNICIYSDGS